MSGFRFHCLTLYHLPPEPSRTKPLWTGISFDIFHGLARRFVFLPGAFRNAAADELRRFKVAFPVPGFQPAEDLASFAFFQVLAEFEFGGEAFRNDFDDGHVAQSRSIYRMVGIDRIIAAFRLEFVHQQREHRRFFAHVGHDFGPSAYRDAFEIRRGRTGKIGIREVGRNEAYSSATLKLTMGLAFKWFIFSPIRLP